MDALIRIILENKASGEMKDIGAAADELAGNVEELTDATKDNSAAQKEATGIVLTYGDVMEGVKAVMSGVSSVVRTLTSDFTDNAIQSQKLATMSGTTVEAFSKIKGAAEDIGVSGETVQGALVMMQRKMQDTGEQGTAFRDALNEMGIGFNDFAGSATGTTDILLAMQKQFEQMPDGPEKTAAAMKVFGRGGAEMLEFLNQSTDGLAANMKAFDELGQTVTKADVQISKDIRGVKNDIMDFAEAATTAIARGMAPMFLETMTAIGKAVETAFHDVVDQFGGVKGATLALTEGLTVLRPAVEAIGPVFKASTDFARGFAFVFAELATAVPLAASAIYGAAAGAASLTGFPELAEGLAASSEQMADMAVKAQDLAQALIGNGEAAAVAGDKMARGAGSMKQVATEVTNATVGLVAFSGVTKTAAEETGKVAEKAKAVTDETRKNADAAAEVPPHLEEQQKRYADILDSRAKQIDAESKVLQKQKEQSAEQASHVKVSERVNDILTSNWVLYADALGVSKEMQLYLAENSSYVMDMADGFESAHTACTKLSGTVQQIAAGTQDAADAAAALQKSITDAVYAQSSLKPITAGQQMGPAGGVTKIGSYEVPLPQQGLPGAAGMSAVTNYQNAVANATALAEADRRNAEWAQMYGGSAGAGGKPAAYGTAGYVPGKAAGGAQIGEMSASYSSRKVITNSGPMGSWNAATGSYDMLSPADGNEPVGRDGLTRIFNYSTRQYEDATQAGSSGKYSQTGRQGVDLASTLPTKITPTFSRAAGVTGGAPIDYDALAAAVARAMGGVSVNMDSRQVGKVLLDATTKGQTMLYAPNGATKAR